jgi:hypothetical protein
MLGSYNCQGSTAANFSHTKSTCRRHVPSGQPMPESRRRQLFAQRTCRRRVLGSSRCQGSTAASFSHTQRTYRRRMPSGRPMLRYRPCQGSTPASFLCTRRTYKRCMPSRQEMPGSRRRQGSTAVVKACLSTCCATISSLYVLFWVHP